MLGMKLSMIEIFIRLEIPLKHSHYCLVLARYMIK